MFGFESFVVAALLLLNAGLSTAGDGGAPKSVEVRVALSRHACDKSISGRVYVLFDANIYGHPLDGPDGSPRKPFFSADVKNWRPGTGVVLANDAPGFPCTLGQLPAGHYAVQALLDTNTVYRDFADSPGSISGGIRSDVVVASLRDDQKNVVALTLDKAAGKREFAETRYIREIKPASSRLTSFYRRPTAIRAAVILPPSYYEDTARKYATVYVFPAFGRRYYSVGTDDFQISRFGMNAVGLEKVFVFLDQTAPYGCHVFADSENNGPWATAFVEELLPYVEKEYRVFAEPSARFLTGQSSGAWAGLWLQVNYPEQFAGVWAASPDPVDFSAFLGVDIYAPGANLFVANDGSKLAMNRMFSDMDRVIGAGWQMGSFEAVFSPRGADRQPRRLWDRDTGCIDPLVAQTWKKYDLRLILESGWAVLAPKLGGKIHVYVADNDRYGLDDPVRSLQQALTAVNANLDINIFPLGGHDLWSDDLRSTIHRQMDDLIVAHHPECR